MKAKDSLALNIGREHSSVSEWSNVDPLAFPKRPGTVASRPRRHHSPAPAPPRPPGPSYRPLALTSEAVVASAALVLSLTTVLTGAWYGLRGSVVTAVPPESVFFYRDTGGEGASSVLTAGVDTALVNSASSNHGDVITRITMEIDLPGDKDPAFNYSVLVTPVFTTTATEQAQNCPVTARCIVNYDEFLTIEEPRRTLDVPGGASRSEYIGFVLQKEGCASPGHCDDYRDFESVITTLERNRSITFRFRYQLHSDGEKIATCVVDLGPQGATTYQPWLASHLTKKGWVQLPCRR